MTYTTQGAGSSIKGVLGKKLGMTQVFDANNKMVPVTVVEAGPCVVTQIRTPEKMVTQLFKSLSAQSTQRRLQSHLLATSLKLA